MDWEIFAKVIDSVTKLATAIAALTAATVAVIGLNAWKRQLKGRTDYEHARKYLRSVYRVRDAVKDVRNPLIDNSEIIKALKIRRKDPSLASNHIESNRAVYNERWKKVIDARSDLDVDVREAEILWGKEAVEVKDEFYACVEELFISLKLFLDVKSAIPDRDIIYAVGERDKFSMKTQESMNKIEEYLQQFLK